MSIDCNSWGKQDTFNHYYSDAYLLKYFFGNDIKGSHRTNRIEDYNYFCCSSDFKSKIRLCCFWDWKADRACKHHSIGIYRQLCFYTFESE